MTRGHGPGRRRPPWWPEDEPWPPRGRGPGDGASAGPSPWRFRRRFLLAAVAIVAVLIGIGFGLGSAVDRRHGPRPGPGGQESDGWPWGPFGIVAFVLVVGGLATKRAYHRLGGPVGELLSGAERLGRGDYDVQVSPAGPQSLRSLADTINDVALRLAASEEQRRRFLADVTHELRTPLAVLQSGIEAQIDGIHPRDDRHLASLLEETQLLGRLVDDLHTLALADAGRLTLHREQTHPSALVADAVESHAALAARKGVVVEASVADGLPELDVDPTRIRQVLANLLSNAVRHTPPGGMVGVKAEGIGGTVEGRATGGGATGGGVIEGGEPAGVRFVVVDSGPGFPAESLGTIFERFTRSADSRGSGLGLSIARDLVVAHGGSITAENVAGGGAAIAFTIPVATTA